MIEERNRAGVRDYLATLRRRKFVILGVMIVAAAIAGALSFAQHKTYTAQAQLNPLDLSQTAGFAGIQQAPVNVPATTSAQLAQTATRTDVMQAVKAKLHLPDSVTQIRNNLSISEDQQSNFVLISANASTPAGAAALANATATAVQNISNAQVRNSFAQDAAADNAEAAKLIAQYGGGKHVPPADQGKYNANLNFANQLGQIAARLSAFSRVATVAQVEGYATPPTSPSAPHPATSIILGAVLGFILSLLVVWFLESLDRRLRRPDEVESVLGIPAIGAIPRGSIGLTPGRDGDAAGLSAFRMIRTQVSLLGSERSGEDERDTRTILVTSAMAGEGKTTVSLGLALSSAASGRTTLLVEADVHRPVHAKRLGLKAEPGLSDYLAGRATPAQILQSYSFVDPALAAANGGAANGHTATLTCITAGNILGFQGAALGAQQFAKMIAEVRDAYDLVVIDTAPLLAVAETSEIVPLVDAIVFCGRIGVTTAEQARAARAALARLPKRPTGLVLTEIEPDTGGYYGYAYEYATASKAAASS